MKRSAMAALAQQERMRREILHTSELIKPLPDIVVKVLALLEEGDIEPQALEDHLQYDQVLVAKLLSMVNSPFYGLNRQIRTIKEAIMVLGYRGLRSLVLASSSARFLDRDFSVYGHDDRGLWKHAIATAAAARSIARQIQRPADRCEEIFVAGLLHDIGKMLLAPYLQKLGLSRLDLDTAVASNEQHHLGIDHTEAGALVAAKWNLSAELQEMIKSHHDEPEPGYPLPDVGLVRLANALAQRAGIGYLPGAAPPAAIHDADLQMLGIPRDAWDEIATTAEQAMYEGVASMIGLVH